MKKTLFIVLAIMLIALCVVSCKSEPEVYSVTLNLNGGTCATELKQYTQGTAVTLPVPTKADSLFAGWYASSDFSGSAVTAISESDSGNKEFWAKWTIGLYDITYKDQGDVAFSGTHGNGYPTKHTYGTATILVNPTKKDYTFDGWYTASDCTGTAVTSLGATDYTSAITLYAKWTAITTFNLNGKYVGGGTPVVDGITDKTKTTSDAFNLPGVVYYSSTNQTKGYAVTKWNTKSDGSGTDYVAGESYTPSTSQTLYAKEGHTWIQLWANGPKWAEFNVGSTITTYVGVSTYDTANIGGHYKFGGTKDNDSGSTAGTNYSDSTTDIQGTGTAGAAAGSLGDTAKILWGSNWVMPKKADLEGLIDTNKCTFEWVETGYGSLKGLKVTGNTTGYTENSIFLPAADLVFSGTFGSYWSSTPDSSNKAHGVNFVSGTRSVFSDDCYEKFSVRAILAETN